MRISLQDLIGLICAVKVFYLLIGSRDQSKENKRQTWYLFHKFIFWLHLHLHGSLELLTAQAYISMPKENLLLLLQFSASEIRQSHSASQILITKGCCFKSALNILPLLVPLLDMFGKKTSRSCCAILLHCPCCKPAFPRVSDSLE